jgi:lysophospholipase L1-like esterase
VVLSCPANIQVASPGGAAVPVTYAAPLASGGTAPISVTCTPPSGGTFPAGSTPVTCTATDAGARRATCGFTVGVTSAPLLTRTRFLAFGDSLTEGKLSVSASLLVDSPSHAYPAKLLALLVERYPTQPIALANEGLGGEKVVDSASRFGSALATHQPESVLLMHGVNDLNGSEDGRVQAVVDSLEDHVKQARSRGMTVFVASLPPLGPPKGGCPECVRPLNERLQSMAFARGAVFVDVYAAWGNGSGLMGADGIHPTEAGYALIAQTFFEAIRKALEPPLP